MNEITVVYCARNLMNGKKYVGVTCDLVRRQREHYALAKATGRQTSFSRAIRKYGEAAFEFSVLSIWDTRELALAEEIRLIAEEKPEYNMTSGGDGAALLTRRRAVIRLSDGCRYETVTSAAKANNVSTIRVVQICQGGGATKSGLLFMYADQPEPPRSIRKDAEQLQKARQKRIVALAKGRRTQSKPVVCVDDGCQFPSISDAARHYGQHLTSVADAIQRNGRAGGLKFELRGAV